MKLTDEEKNYLNKLMGNDYLVITKVEGKCFSLNVNGTYTYNECFEQTSNPFFMKQRYELLTPIKMIKFFQFYLMESKEDAGVWYRGVLNNNGNYEFDCCAESLEEIISSL